MNKSVYGVGLNDSNYVTQINQTISRLNGIRKSIVIWKCPYYKKWCDMLKRCYNEKDLLKNPSYTDCYVCEDWLTFSNFRAWMECQDWFGKQLDKDLLIPNNKSYSKETCCFIDANVNALMTERSSARGLYPIGVSLHKGTNKFAANCNNGSGKYIYLGLHNTPEEAHKAWRKYKHELACKLADEEADTRIAQALRTRYKDAL